MPLRPMAERLTRPDWVRRLNLMADAIGGDGRAIVPIDPRTILERAETAVGRPTGDFGDPGWPAKFTALAEAMDAADLHLVGRLLSRQELERAVRTRLLATHAVDASPEIASGAVVAPIVITGPARSGTTILFELLALDPALRAPMPVDALSPAPGPEPVLASARELTECEHELWSDVQPELRAMHDFSSDRPVECGTVTQGSFCGFHWSMIGQFDGAPMDYEVSYDYERRFLQVLQHGAPAATWVLKTPAHITTLPLVFATFPDAWVVQTHRDPAKTIPSTVDLVATMSWLRTDHVDVDALALLLAAAFSGALNDCVGLRESGAVPPRFVDVHFAALVSDPVGTIGLAYEQMGRALTDDHAAAITRYVAANPPGRFGTHVYRPEDWGFTAEGIRGNMATYLDHFDVRLEPTR